jgi:uncharacterized delta-60 repeat protein
MNTILHVILIAFLCLQTIFTVTAQTGSADPNFNGGTGAQGEVFDFLQLNDGKIILAGAITSYNGVACNRIVRLNVDGTPDPTFNVGNGFNAGIRTLALQADGKILAGGEFTSFNNTSTNRIIRLNANGTRDESFVIGNGFNLPIQSIAVQDDGKILVGGQFNFYNGVSHNRIIRLNPNGAMDETFNIGSGVNALVHHIEVQSNQKILLSGDFNLVNGITSTRLVLLNADGTIDIAFNNTLGANALIRKASYINENRILLAGDFKQVNNTPATHLAIINNDGSLDPTFSVHENFNQRVKDFYVNSENEIYAVGDFSLFDTFSYNAILKLLPNGILDTNFVVNTAANSRINKIKLLADNQFCLAGNFEQFRALQKKGFVKIDQIGNPDYGFNVGGGIGLNGAITTIAEQADGKIIIAGTFTSYQNQTVNRICRIHKNGTLDTSFLIDKSPNNDINKIIVQPDGKIIVAGAFTNFNDSTINRIVRLNSDGSFDSTFVIGNGPNNLIRDVALQADGKILIGGQFTNYAGTARNRVARLNSNGSLDTDFVIGSGANNEVWSILTKPDGKILIGGQFTSYAGVTRNRIAQINADGSLDLDFNSSTGANNTIRNMTLQQDGKIILAGNLTSYNGAGRLRLARINPDATLDESFVPSGSIPNNTLIHRTLVQSDGSIILVGSFTSYNNLIANRIVKINNNGSIAIQNFGAGTTGEIFDAVMASDGNIIIAGQFRSFNGQVRNGLARIMNCNRPVLNVSNPVCEGSDLNLSISNAANYVWSGPNSFTSVLQNPIIENIETAASGRYTITTDDNQGCSSELSFDLSVTALPTVNISTENEICEGETLILSSDASGSFKWSGPDNFVSEQNNVPISNVDESNAGIYTLELNRWGCVASAELEVNVIPSPELEISSNSPVCEGDNLQFNAAPNLTYSWTGPIGLSFSIRNPTIPATLGIAGTYQLTGVSAQGCINTGEVEVFVNEKPQISFSSNSPVCIGQTALLAAFGGENYSWTGPNGFSSNAQTPVFLVNNVAQAGVYEVTVADFNDCKNSASITLVVDECVGIEDLQQNSSFTIFPNPANTTVNIKNLPANTLLTIMDLNGKVVVREMVYNSTQSIQIDHLHSGVYLVNVLNKTQKLVVVR